MLEKTVEAYLVERVRALGGTAYKFTSPARASVPDRIVILPPGRIFFVEVKRPGGKLTRGQEREHEHLRRLGADVRVLDSIGAINAFLNEVETATAVPGHVRFLMESTARWLEGGCDPLAAAKEIRACLAKFDAAPAAPVAEPAPAENAELANMTRMFHAACADLGLINEALGLDPDDGGAEPILDAIQKLKDERDQWADAGYAAQAVAADGAIQDIDTKAIAESLERMIVDWYADCERSKLDWKQMAGVIKLRLDRFLKRAAVSPASADRICTLIPLSERHPAPDEHPRVIVFTDGSDFNGAQFFDVSADSLNECFYESPDEQPDVCRHATHWMPRPSLHNAAPATAEPCAHDYVRSDRVCTECGEKTATADERAAFETCGPEACTTDERCKAEQQCGWRTIGRASQAAAPADARSLLRKAHRTLACAALTQIRDGETVWTEIGRFLDAAPAEAREPDAYVPIHPRNGPLWASTVTSLDADRPKSYPVKPVYLGVPADAGEAVARLDDADIDTIAESMPGGLDSFMKQWGWRQFARAVEDEVIINAARAQGAQGGKGGEA